MSSSEDRELARARAAKLLRDNFPVYARECLKIRTKEHGILPLHLSATQRFVQNRHGFL